MTYKVNLLYNIKTKSIIRYNIDKHRNFKQYIGIVLEAKHIDETKPIMVMVKHYDPKVIESGTALCYKISYPESIITPMIDKLRPHARKYIHFFNITTLPPILSNYKSNRANIKYPNPFTTYFDYHIRNLINIINTPTPLVFYSEATYRFPIDP